MIGKQANGFLSAAIPLTENLAPSDYSVNVEHIYKAGNSTDILGEFTITKNQGFIYIYTSSSAVSVGDRISVIATIS